MILLVHCFFLLGISCALAIPTKVINTTSGPVRGKLENGIRSFLSIPYAKPPVGELRFKNPESHPPWTKVLKCTKQAKQCPQFHLMKHMVIGHEDCLYLDIHVPKEKKGNELFPVLFWIYGGGWILGDQYEFGVYNVKHLIKSHDIIIVSVNYRLGPFGFMALDELSEESSMKSSGNNAMLDQSMALKWAHENIRAFGGDPDRITIMGESAGAFSVCWHLAAPVSKGLFHGAIMESGTCDRHEFFRKLDDAKSFSRMWVDTHGCPNLHGQELLACIRKVKPRDFMAWKNVSNFTNFRPSLYPFMPWATVIDGNVLPDVPLSLIKQNKWNSVPLLIGSNHDEGTLFLMFTPILVPGFRFPFTAEKYDKALLHFYKNLTMVNMIKEKYPVIDNHYGNNTAAILRDTFFVCGTRRIARTLTEVGQSVWIYQFNFNKGLFYNTPFGDFHSSELLMVFDNYRIIHPNHAEKQMVKTFHFHWTNMVKYGSPNSPSGVVPPVKPDIVLDWPVWNTTSKQNMELNIPPSINDHLKDKLCDFWDTFSP